MATLSLLVVESTTTWNDIEGNANKFIAVSSSGVVNSSNDGATWSDISGSVGSDTFTGVAAIGQTWIIVSDTGVVYRSTDNGSSSVSYTHLTLPTKNEV